MRYKDSTHDWIWITEDEAQRVIANLRPAHWRLPVQILYHYGLRASELLHLTPLNVKNGELVIQRLKNGRMTRQFLVPEIRVELEALCATRKPTQRLFPWAKVNLWRALQNAANRSGVPNVKAHPHAFRHACGRKWARIGTINEVSAMLGHKSIQATMMYTRLECDVDLSRKFLIR
jgi:integrase